MTRAELQRQPPWYQRWRSWLPAALLTIALGVLGSAFWEMLFRPSLGWFGRGTLALLTLGSTKVKDLAYQSAALDPTPLSSLALVLCTASIPIGTLLGLLGYYAGRRYGRSLRRRATDMAARDPSRSEDEWTVFFDKRSHLLAVSVLSILLCCVGSYSFVSAQVLNQSVLIWRVFQADLAICAPYMTAEQEKHLSAQFRQVRTKADYRALAVELESIARAGKASLVPVDLW